MVFPAARLLLPESEGGRNGRGVGWGWTGEVGVGGTGCLFYGRISFSLETLSGALPSTPLPFPGMKAWGGEKVPRPTWLHTPSHHWPSMGSRAPAPTHQQTEAPKYISA